MEANKKQPITLANLKPAPGSNHRKKVVGRGVGSGHGRHATRGMKGQRSRSGDTKMIGFEGGQIPLLRRIPKRGFTPPFPKKFEVLNVGDLNDLFKDKAQVTLEYLHQEGIIKRNIPLKILGDGNITKALNVEAHAFSSSAKMKIESAGGTVRTL